MRLEKLPSLKDIDGVKAKVYGYIVALFLIGGLEQAKQLEDALREILATVQNAIYREEKREANPREML